MSIGRNAASMTTEADGIRKVGRPVKGGFEECGPGQSECTV